MNLVLNIIWIICGGFIICLEYILSSLLLMCTIVGIPFGIQTFKLGILSLCPFGCEVRSTPTAGGCLGTLMNVLWIFLGGIWICISHLLLGLLLCITIIGIPFGRQHFKLATLALTPFGKEVVY
ncbi:MAG: YccF domain-containing protein [Phocaeicola sp.]|nr:YccF domain-containing protein [Phocaeicola sp.]